VKNYIKNVFPSPGVTNYDYLSSNLEDIKKNAEVMKSLSKIYPENSSINKASGLDLFTLDNTGNYKYITGNGQPSQKIFYSKWKDTAFV
jgi:hypothetical protein